MQNASPMSMKSAASSGSMVDPAQDTIYRKITMRVMPVVLIAYIFAFLDRINVGYAQLQMKHDLGFSDAVYGLGAGIFFLTYLLLEVPSNLLLEKIGARLTFLRIMVLWGLTSASTAFVTAPWQFYCVRLLLGMFEAGFFPGIILYLTYWYPSHRRGRVTGLFLFGMPITGVIGGPISGMIMSGMEGVGGWHGWQWLFLVEGIPTALVGVIVYRLLSNRPSEARWLTDAEKSVVVSLLDADQKERPRQAAHGRVRAAFADPKTYLLAFIYFCCTSVVYTLTFWLPTMIKGLGISNIANIGWYSAIPYIFGAIGIIVTTRSSDRFQERRWHTGGTLVLGAVALYSTTFLGTATLPVMIVLCVAAFFIFGGGTLFWSIPPTYLGREAAAAGIAVISSIGILGAFLSPTIIGWIKTTTGSIQTGLLAITVLTVCGGVATLLALPKSALRVGGGGSDGADEPCLAKPDTFIKEYEAG